MDLRELAGSHLRSAASSWSIGALGAIAEFHRDASEPVELGELRAVTARGAIGVLVPAGARTFDGGRHGIALCLPESEARMAARTRVTALGRDVDALRAREREALLFDLGLGLANCDFCVRTADAALIDALCRAEGTALLENAPLVEALKRASPQRVVRSRAGRIEVFQDIAPDGGRSPEGPHTHLLPGLLREGRTHAAGAGVPDGWMPCVTVYPLKSVHEVL
jgi:uncharacterized protein DUF6925